MANNDKEIQDLRGALSKANEEIERLSRVKSDFISIISHELRTPLTSIKESVSLVLDGIAGPLNEEQKKFLTISKNNIDRLTRLITNILDLSRIEAGRIVMRKKKLNINDIIKDVYNAARSEAEQKNIELSISLGDPLEPTWFDPDRITQALKNLISNAIKFNRDKGSIKISSSEGEINGREFIKVVVEDSGIGIQSEDKENLFKNFSPLDASMTRKQSGAGLGLAISKGIIELHGGDIRVVSEPDVGSKFIFTIPVYKKYEEFDFLMDEAMERARHNDLKIALVAFEIKDEKDRNEEVFAEIENIVRKTARGPEDKVAMCRNGEYIALIASTDRPGALAIIKRINGRIKIPLVFGISVYPDEAANKDELMQKIEEDLSSNKNAIVPQG